MWRRVVSAGSESVVSDRQGRFVSNHTTTTSYVTARGNLNFGGAKNGCAPGTPGTPRFFLAHSSSKIAHNPAVCPIRSSSGCATTSGATTSSSSGCATRWARVVAWGGQMRGWWVVGVEGVRPRTRGVGGKETAATTSFWSQHRASQNVSTSGNARPAEGCRAPAGSSLGKGQDAHPPPVLLLVVY
jgi:hypothetical protein